MRTTLLGAVAGTVLGCAPALTAKLTPVRASAPSPAPRCNEDCARGRERELHRLAALGLRLPVASSSKERPAPAH